MTDSKSKLDLKLYLSLDLDIIPCTDLHEIIKSYYYR